MAAEGSELPVEVAFGLPDAQVEAAFDAAALSSFQLDMRFIVLTVLAAFSRALPAAPVSHAGRGGAAE